MTSTTYSPFNPQPETEYVRQQILTWLRDLGIDTKQVPAMCRASVADGELTIDLFVRGPQGQDRVANPEDPSEAMKHTVTVPVTVAPPPAVEIWLAPKCPECGR